MLKAKLKMDEGDNIVRKNIYYKIVPLNLFSPKLPKIYILVRLIKNGFKVIIIIMSIS